MAEHWRETWERERGRPRETADGLLLLPRYNVRCLKCSRVMDQVDVDSKHGPYVRIVWRCPQHGAQTSFRTTIDFEST